MPALLELYFFPLRISVVSLVLLTVLHLKKKLIQGEGNTPDFFFFFFFNMERGGVCIYWGFFLF